MQLRRSLCAIFKGKFLARILLKQSHVKPFVRKCFPAIVLITMILSPSGSLGSGRARIESDLMKRMSHINPDQAAKVISSGPSAEELHAEVLRAASLSGDEAAVWKKRAARAAWLPRLQVGFRHAFQDHIDVSIKDNVSVTSSGVVIGPRASDIAERSDRNAFVEVKAVWALNELVFSPDTLNVSQEARNRRKEIREILQRATELHSKWRALCALSRERGSGAQVLLYLSETTGELDGLTDGWFSKMTARLCVL